MSDYRDVLERELERLSPPRIPIDRLVRRRDRKRRNQRIGAAVVGIAVSLVAIGSLIRLVDEGGRSGRPSPSPSMERVPEPADLSLVEIPTGRARPLPDSISTIPHAGGFKVSPDGVTLAFDASTPNGIQIFIGDADGSNIRKVTTDDMVDARNPSWSPDGTKLVYEGLIFPAGGGIEDDLFVLDLATGVSLRLRLDLHVVPYFGVHTPSFGPDGRTIVYTDYDPERDSVELLSVSINGGSSALVKRQAAFGAASPDGQTIAYRRAMTIPGVGTAVSLMTIDGTELPAPDGGPLMGALLEVDRGTTPAWSPSGRRVAYTDPAANIPPRRIHVFDLDTGRVTLVGRGTEVAWLDDDTLIVRDYEARRG